MRISTLTVEKTDMSNAGVYVCRTTDKMNAEVSVRILNGKTTPRVSVSGPQLSRSTVTGGLLLPLTPSQQPERQPVVSWEGREYELNGT